MTTPTVTKFGEQAILIQWDQLIDDSIHSQVLSFGRYVFENFSEVIQEIVPTYNSLAVYTSEEGSRDALFSEIQATVSGHSFDSEERKAHVIHIPVCYEGAFAPDLQTVAEHSGLSEAEVINIHSAPLYKVYFTGFLPGFPYLGGLDKQLHTPRRETPRPHVAMGSVGIGGVQTGVYPLDSPGGWNIIGRSPIRFFDARKEPPVAVEAGDYVKFLPIDRDKFENTLALVENGIYLLNKTVYGD